jgi:D-3-phosphoglycerate dehydrogenase
MTKRVMVQTGIREGIRKVFDTRPDVEYELFTETSEENLLLRIVDYDAVLLGLAPLTAQVVAKATRLKVAARLGVGYDSVDVPALTRAGIPLAVVGTANSVSVAEHTLYMMLALAKCSRVYDREIRKGNWSIRRVEPCFDLAGRKVLILGFGRIGGYLVKRLLAMEMEIFIYDPYIDPRLITGSGATPVTDWRAMLPQVDFLSINCPKTKETTGMVGSAELDAMKSTAFVVNTARGGIVEEKALYQALKEKTIAAAGLDAFDLEPPPVDWPLFELDNILLSPHIAGTTEEAMYRMDFRAAQNIVDAFDGKLDPDYVVNKEVLN